MRADVEEAVEQVEESEEATVEVPVEAVEQVSKKFEFSFFLFFYQILGAGWTKKRAQERNIRHQHH